MSEINELSQKVFNTLDEMKINYSVVDHPAAYDMADLESLNIDKK